MEKIIRVFGEDLSEKTIAVWGLAFKPETDDMRESAAIDIIQALTKRGANVRAYDPKARAQAEACYLKDIEKLSYVNSKYDALNDADALVLVTEWKEFRSPDFFEMAQRVKGKVIFDGRNQYKEKTLRSHGFAYYQIGVREA